MRQFVAASLMAFALSAPAFAQHPHAGEGKPAKIVELKDGTTLHVYADGKMAHHDSRNRPIPMKSGDRMETRSGEVLMMRGNEVWRLIEPNKIGD